MKIQDYSQLKIPSEFAHLTFDELEKEFGRVMGDFSVKHRLSIDKQMALISIYFQHCMILMGMNEDEDIAFMLLIGEAMRRAIEISKPSRKEDDVPRN